MHNPTIERSPDPLEIEFVKGHIAATMTLIHGLIDQDVLDRNRLDAFFGAFLEGLPHERATFGLRLVINQWRQGLIAGESVPELRERLFEVIAGGRTTN